MNIKRLWLAVGFVLVCAWIPSAKAQTKQYLRAGLSFTYPSEWPLIDDSDIHTQSLNLDRGQNEAKIMIIAMRVQMNAAQFAEAQPRVTEAIATAVAQEIAKSGVPAQRSSITERVAGVTAQGARFHPGLRDDTGDVDILWLHLGGRLVHVIFVGSDQQRSRAAYAWSMVRNTLRVGTAPVTALSPPDVIPDLNN